MQTLQPALGTVLEGLEQPHCLSQEYLTVMQNSTDIWCCQRGGLLHATAATTRCTPEPCLGKQSPWTIKAHTLANEQMCSMVKSPGSQLPTDKYITCTERKKQTQNYLYNSQSWINCMTSEDEPHTGTGSWPLVMHRHGQKESKSRRVMRKLVDVCKSHIVPCFDSPASLEQSYKVRKWQRRGLRAWKTLSHKAT